MARDLGLSKYQQHLLARLAKGTKEGIQVSSVAFVSGPQNWLIRFEHMLDVLVTTEVFPVPFTRAWFLGIANVRGRVAGVLDLATLLGQRAAPPREGALIALRTPQDMQLAVLADNVIGLRRADEFSASSGPPLRYAREMLQDKSEGAWAVLDVDALTRELEVLDLPEAPPAAAALA